MASNATYGLVLMIVLQFVCFVGLQGVNAIGGDNYYGNVNNSLISGGAPTRFNISSQSPSGSGTVAATTGTTWVDTFASSKDWFLGLPGINQAYTFVMTPYNILSLTKLPSLLTGAIGTMWYLIASFYLFSFFWGKA